MGIVRPPQIDTIDKKSKKRKTIAHTHFYSFRVYFRIERFCSLKTNIFLLQKMKLFILLPSGAYAAGFETTICNCTTPIRQEHLRIDDDHCQPIRRPTQRKANYAVWTDRQDGLKVRACICSRWEKINHVKTNVFFQKIAVLDEQAIGSLHEISIGFRHTWLESVFHADSHGILFFFLNQPKCVYF